jgi:hypothetical protein
MTWVEVDFLVQVSRWEGEKRREEIEGRDEGSGRETER